MKNILILAISILFYSKVFALSFQVRQQTVAKTKTEKIPGGCTDSSGIKNSTTKAQPSPASQNSKQKPKQQTASDDAEFLGPLSWKPGLLF